MAVRLRQRGFTYPEIQAQIPALPKGTLAGWMKNLELPPVALQRLERRMSDGRERARFRAIISNRARRMERERQVAVAARQEFGRFKSDPLFLVGLALYLAEGSKRSGFFQFINSSPQLIRIMVKWVEKFLGIRRTQWRFRLYIHRPYAHERCEEFWSRVVRVPVERFSRTVYKPTPHTVKKNPDYRGCLRINAGGIDGLRRIRVWGLELYRHLRL